MIRVLEFADVINRFDFIDTLVEYADRTEFEMSVCVRSEDHNISTPQFSNGTKYKLLPGNSRRHALQTAWKLSRLLKEWNIDVLHAHHFEQALIGWWATRLYRRTRLVLGRHYSDALYRNPSRLKRRGLLAIENRINRHAARIIVPSRMIADIMVRRQGVPADKVDVVYYGFVPEKYATVTEEDALRARVELGMTGRFTVGNFSRLHEEKGHSYLLEAADIARKDIPDLLVLIIGEGPERATLERRIVELRLEETVRLLGWRRDAMTIMSAVDAVTQSTLQEAFSQVMCEAMWLGKPLLMTDVSGAGDIINDGLNGLLVPKADADALAAGITRLVHEPELRRRLGRNGRRFVSATLAIDRVIGCYEDSFRKAAKVS